MGSRTGLSSGVSRMVSPTVVGRAEELRALVAAVAAPPAVAVVVGEAGIGKTRLVAELAATSTGRRIVSGACRWIREPSRSVRSSTPSDRCVTSWPGRSSPPSPARCGRCYPRSPTSSRPARSRSPTGPPTATGVPRPHRPPHRHRARRPRAGGPPRGRRTAEAAGEVLDQETQALVAAEVDGFAKVLLTYRKGLPTRWQAPDGATVASVEVEPTHPQEVRAFLSVLFIDDQRPNRGVIGHAAPSMDAVPTLARLGRLDVPRRRSGKRCWQCFAPACVRRARSRPGRFRIGVAFLLADLVLSTIGR